MKKKVLLGILLILIVISGAFVKAESADVNKLANEVAKKEDNLALSTPKDELIYSNKFLVKGKIISRIDPKTTIEDFRKNIEVTKGKEIKIYKGKKEQASGYIGTGMIIKGPDEQEYTTSVTGDLIGDGKPNQVELTMMIRHIIELKGWELEGIEKISSDINGDGKVNLVDINKLINYIVYEKWEQEEIKTPRAPTINVITKKDENKDYYIGEVEIKIDEDKTTKNAKTTYIITGSTEQKETEIKEGEIIKLTEEGEYLITAYTYGIKGNKSKGASKLIKVVGPVPNLTAGNTIMVHSPKSWTNGSVTVAIQTDIKGYILQYSKDGVKWQDYTKEIEVVQNGKIYARLRDNLGNAGGKIGGNISNIDKVAPTVTLSPNGGDGYTMPSKGNAKINTIITAVDPEKTETNGCSDLKTLEYAWSESKDIEPEVWTEFVNGSKVEKTDIQAPGTWYLWTKVVDRAGNRAESIKVSNPFIVKSNEDPANSITLKPNKTGWTNGNVTVTASFGKNLVQNKTLICSGTAGADFVVNGLESVVVKTNGKTVTAVARDIAGNTVGKELTINNIDKALPAVSDLTANPAPCANRNVTITAKAIDTQSGIIAYQFSKVNNLTAESEGWTTVKATNAQITQTKEVSQTGIYYFYAKDAVGNVSKKQIAIIIDKVAPEVTAPASTVVGNTVKVEAKDAGSGVSYWAHSTNSDIPEAWTEITNAKEQTINFVPTLEGTNYIFVKDLAGNVSYTSIKVAPARWNNARIKTNYTTLKAAMLVANSGDTLTLLADYEDTTEASLSLNKNITLDTNGKTLTKSINTIRIDEGSTLNIRGTGTIKSTSDDIAIFFNCGTLNINGGTINSDYNVVWNQGNVNMTAGKLTGGMQSKNGQMWSSIVVEKGNVNISGGTVTGGGTAIELRGNANITVRGNSTVIKGGETAGDYSAISCTSYSTGTVNIIGSPSITSKSGKGIENLSTNVTVNK